eukprot:gene11747-12967_t
MEFGNSRRNPQNGESDDDIHDERLRGVRSFFLYNNKRSRQDHKELSKKDIGSLIYKEATNFSEERTIGEGLHILERQQVESGRTNGTTDQKTKFGNIKNENGIRILGSLRKLQKNEGEISEDERNREFEFEPRARATMEGSDMEMSGSNRKKKNNAPSAEEMLKISSYGMERYQKLLEKYNDKIAGLKEKNSKSDKEITMLKDRVSCAIIEKSNAEMETAAMKEDFQQIKQHNDMVLNDLRAELYKERLEGDRKEENERILTIKNNKMANKMTRMKKELEENQNKMAAIELKSTELEAVKDSLQLQVQQGREAERVEKEKSKAARDKVFRLNKTMTELRLKNETLKKRLYQIIDENNRKNEEVGQCNTEQENVLQKKEEERNSLLNEVASLKIQDEGNKKLMKTMKKRLKEVLKQNDKLQGIIMAKSIEKANIAKYEDVCQNVTTIRPVRKDFGSQTEMKLNDPTSALTSMEVSQQTKTLVCELCIRKDVEIQRIQTRVTELEFQNDFLLKVKIPRLEDINRKRAQITDQAIQKCSTEQRDTKASHGEVETPTMSHEVPVKKNEMLECSRVFEEYRTVVKDRLKEEKISMKKLMAEMALYADKIKFHQVSQQNEALKNEEIPTGSPEKDPLKIEEILREKNELETRLTQTMLRLKEAKDREGKFKRKITILKKLLEDNNISSKEVNLMKGINSLQSRMSTMLASMQCYCQQQHGSNMFHQLESKEQVELVKKTVRLERKSTGKKMEKAVEKKKATGLLGCANGETREREQETNDKGQERESLHDLSLHDRYTAAKNEASSEDGNAQENKIEEKWKSIVAKSDNDHEDTSSRAGDSESDEESEQEDFRSVMRRKPTVKMPTSVKQKCQQQGTNLLHQLESKEQVQLREKAAGFERKSTVKTIGKPEERKKPTGLLGCANGDNREREQERKDQDQERERECLHLSLHGRNTEAKNEASSEDSNAEKNKIEEKWKSIVAKSDNDQEDASSRAGDSESEEKDSRSDTSTDEVEEDEDEIVKEKELEKRVEKGDNNQEDASSRAGDSESEEIDSRSDTNTDEVEEDEDEIVKGKELEKRAEKGDDNQEDASSRADNSESEEEDSRSETSIDELDVEDGDKIVKRKELEKHRRIELLTADDDEISLGSFREDTRHYMSQISPHKEMTWTLANVKAKLKFKRKRGKVKRLREANIYENDSMIVLTEENSIKCSSRAGGKGYKRKNSRVGIDNSKTLSQVVPERNASSKVDDEGNKEGDEDKYEEDTQEKKKRKFSNLWKGFRFKKINTNIKENNELKNDGENNEESESKSCELKDNKDKKAYAKKLKKTAKEEKKKDKKAEKKKKKKEDAKKKAETKKNKERGDDDNQKLKKETKEDKIVKEKNNNKKIKNNKTDKKQRTAKKEEKRAAKEEKRNAIETEPVPGPSNLGHNQDALKRVVKRKDKQDRRSLSIKLKNAFKKRSSKVMIANDNNGESQVTYEDSEDSDESQTKIECRNKLLHSKEDNSYQEHHKIIVVNCIHQDGPTTGRNQT